MANEVHVRGLSELQKFLDELPQKVEQNILRSALSAGARVVRDQAKANAPVKTGTLRAGLKVSSRISKGVVTASVKAKGKHGYLAPWLEYGTSAHKIAGKKGGWLSFGGIFAKSVEHPGISPRPFLRPALEARAQDALVAVGEAIKKRLTREGLNTADISIEADE
jgi:HK97 gp10 family phage protein